MKQEDPAQLWAACLSELRNMIPAQTFATWFERTKGHEVTLDTFTIEVPNPFSGERILKRFHDKIRQVVTTQDDVLTRNCHGHPIRGRWGAVDTPHLTRLPIHLGSRNQCGSNQGTRRASSTGSSKGFQTNRDEDKGSVLRPGLQGRSSRLPIDPQ